MRKILVALLIVVLGASCLGAMMGQAFAQTTAPTTSPPPLIIRWMRFYGAITQWGSDESYKGSLTVNTKTANVPAAVFKPWVAVDAFWSNEPRFPATKPTGKGQYTFTHYVARLVKLTSIEKPETAFIVVVTGLWVVNQVKITTDFDENGVPVKVVREVISKTEGNGKLQITSDWKKFTIEIDGIKPLQGVQIRMMTTTTRMSPFSYARGPTPTVKDLMTVAGCLRATPGFASFIPELDYNKDSRIDIADLTTVAANM